MTCKSVIIEPAPVMLVGGGSVNRRVLEELVALGIKIYAADSGADCLARYEHIPEGIIGDMDSIDDIKDWQGRTKIVEILEQDTTDFEKCLYSVQAPAYFCLGFLGVRFDHSLATMHVLAKYHDRNCIVIGDHDLVLATSQNVSFTCPHGSRVSIYPLGEVKFQGSSGLQYPLTDLQMKVGQMIGTSNKAAAEHVHIQVERGTYGVVMDVEHYRQFL